MDLLRANSAFPISKTDEISELKKNIIKFKSHLKHDIGFDLEVRALFSFIFLPSVLSDLLRPAIPLKIFCEFELKSRKSFPGKRLKNVLCIL